MLLQNQYLSEMGEKPLSLQPNSPQTHRVNENIGVALKNKEGKRKINGVMATMADACRTYICRYNILPVSLLIASAPATGQFALRSRSKAPPGARKRNAARSPREDSVSCEMDKILTKSWDRALATLHLVMVAKLAGAENFPACSVLHGKSEKCLPSVQGCSTILFLARTISAPQRRASKPSVVRQGFT